MYKTLLQMESYFVIFITTARFQKHSFSASLVVERECSTNKFRWYASIVEKNIH